MIDLLSAGFDITCQTVPFLPELARFCDRAS